MNPPPGFQGPPHFAPHGGPHQPPHAGFGQGLPPCGGKFAKQHWHQYKEEKRNAKKTLSREEYEKFKEQHKDMKEMFKQLKKARKHGKHGKKGGKWGHGRGHHDFPHPHGGPHGHHGGPFGGPHGMPFGGPHGMPFGGPFGRGGPHGMPFPGPGGFPRHEGPAFGGPGLYPHLGGPFGAPNESKLIARHVKDVTIEDGTQLPPATPFVKTWRVRNEGPAWPAGCQLHFLSKRCGDIMSGPDFVTIEGPVETNQEVDVSVNLVSPAKPGRYVGFWKLCTPNGRKFGQRMWVSIIVPASNSSSSDEDDRVADQYALLVDTILAQGFDVKRHRVFRLLEKHNGDMQVVSNILADKAHRKAEKEAKKLACKNRV